MHTLQSCANKQKAIHFSEFAKNKKKFALSRKLCEGMQTFLEVSVGFGSQQPTVARVHDLVLHDQDFGSDH